MTEGRWCLSEEQADFVRKAMTIGAGNAATALTQLFDREAEVAIPDLRILGVPEAIGALGDPSLPVVCVRMKMTGDASGELFFIVSENDRGSWMSVLQQAWPVCEGQTAWEDLETFKEIGSIIAGVYLTAVHDFSGLNLCHTLPQVQSDMMLSLLDESIAALVRDSTSAILIVNEFRIAGERAKSFFLLMPSGGSIGVIGDSIDRAMAA